MNEIVRPHKSISGWHGRWEACGASASSYGLESRRDTWVFEKACQNWVNFHAKFHLVYFNIL